MCNARCARAHDGDAAERTLSNQLQNVAVDLNLRYNFAQEKQVASCEYRCVFDATQGKAQGRARPSCRMSLLEKSNEAGPFCIR